MEIPNSSVRSSSAILQASCWRRRRIKTTCQKYCNRGVSGSLQRQKKWNKIRSKYLEVVPKGPGAQHFKEGVVVNVFPHIIQVVVFASCTDALLSVGGTPQLGHGVGGVYGVEEDGLVLQQGGKKKHSTIRIGFEVIESETFEPG